MGDCGWVVVSGCDCWFGGDCGRWVIVHHFLGDCSVIVVGGWLVIVGDCGDCDWLRVASFPG